MNDRELLEMAAKAAGMEINQARQAERDTLIDPETAGLWIKGGCTFWNPLTDDAHALRLAVKLDLLVDSDGHTRESQAMGQGADERVEHGKDKFAATRLAIVRAAADIGRRMP